MIKAFTFKVFLLKVLDFDFEEHWSKADLLHQNIEGSPSSVWGIRLEWLLNYN